MPTTDQGVYGQCAQTMTTNYLSEISGVLVSTALTLKNWNDKEKISITPLKNSMHIDAVFYIFKIKLILVIINLYTLNLYNVISVKLET